MVSSGFFENIWRDDSSDTTSSEDGNSPRQDIVSITPPARVARLRERISNSVVIAGSRKLFTCVTPPADLARHHPTLVSGLKQKIVLKVLMNDSKSRTRSMKIAVGVPGVISVELDGKAEQRIVVIGAGIDATVIAKLLRRKIGFTELVSVAPVKRELKLSGSTLAEKAAGEIQRAEGAVCDNGCIIRT